MAPTVDCRFGLRCTRADCTFRHPAPPTATDPAWVVCGKFGDRRCRSGLGCANAQCGFAHPPDWRFFYGTESTVTPAATPATPASSSGAVAAPPAPQAGGFGGGFASGADASPSSAVIPSPPPPPPPQSPSSAPADSANDAHALAATLGDRADAGAAQLSALLAGGLGADATKRGGMFDQWTLLHSAAYAGNVPAIRVLLAAGARLTVTNKKGDTPLRLATARGHTAAVEVLVRAGADPAAANLDGSTALQAARDKFGADPAKLDALLQTLSLEPEAAATPSPAAAAAALNPGAVVFVPTFWDPAAAATHEAELGFWEDGEGDAGMGPTEEEQAWLDACLDGGADGLPDSADLEDFGGDLTAEEAAWLSAQIG